MTDSRTISPSRLARADDPEESKKAAREIASKIPRLQNDILNFVTMYPDRTTNELSDLMHLRDPRHIGRRLSELFQDGRIDKVGARPCRITRRTAAIWRAR